MIQVMNVKLVSLDTNINDGQSKEFNYSFSLSISINSDK